MKDDELRRYTERASAMGFVRPEDVRSESEPDAPERLGKFQILSLLGSGGSGHVYLALDDRLNRQVALKILEPTGKSMMDRFIREARVAAKLDHPNIVRIYEADAVDGRHYISMQYIDGQSVEELGLDEERLIQVAATIARALDYAHRQGIVHRDVTPANILIDKSGKVFLTDFGLGKEIESEKGPTLTMSGSILGTPAFMSPEQALGKVHQIDPRTDVYGLGATLYYLLTGACAHDDPSILQTIHRIVHEDPVPPRRLNPKISSSVEGVILHAMEKDPARRYATTAEFAEELENALAGRPIRGTMRLRFRRSARKMARYWAPAAILILILALAAIGLRSGPSQEIYSKLQAASKKIADFEKLIYGDPRDMTREEYLLDEAVKLCDEASAASEWGDFDAGRALALKRDLNGALRRFDRAIERSSQSRFFYERGRTRLRLYRELVFQMIDPVLIEQAASKNAELMTQAAADLQVAANAKDLQPWELDFVQAELLHAHHKTAEALSLIDRALPSCDAAMRPELLKLKGDLLLMDMKYSEAIECYRETIKHKRCFHSAYVRLATCLLLSQSGKDDLGSLLDVACSIYPDEILTRVLRAVHRSGRITVDPPAEPAAFRSALAEIAADVNAGLAIDASFAPAHLASAYLWLATVLADTVEGKSPMASRKLAIESAQRAVSLAPEYTMAHSVLLWARFGELAWLVRNGMPAEDSTRLTLEAAASALSLCERIKSGHVNLRVLRADATYVLAARTRGEERSKSLETALREYGQILNEHPTHSKATSGKIRTLYTLERFAEALSEAEKADVGKSPELRPIVEECRRRLKKQ